MRYPACNPDFDDSSVAGAGILPYSVRNGEVHFLLARERSVMHWRGSHKWSAFEGSRKPGEDACTNASREFVEESLGVVPLFDDCRDTESVRRGLSGEKYALRVATKRGDSVHVTYVVYVPYMDQVVDDFTNMRKRVMQLSKLVADFASSASFRDYPDFNSHFRGFDIDRVASAVVEDKAMKITCIGGSPAVMRSIHLPADATYVTLMQQKIKANAAVEVFLARQVDLRDHPCIERSAVVASRGEQKPPRFRINCDFLEKDCLRYWTAGEVQEAIRNNGIFKKEMYRPYFMPVIDATVANLGHLIGYAETHAAAT